MSFVVLDTDVTSNAFKRRTLPPPIVAAILHNRLCITFITLAELTKWAVRRHWGATYRSRLDAWLGNVLVLPYNNEIEDIARTWALSLATPRTVASPAAKRYVDSCLLPALRPAAGHAQREGLQRLRQH